MNAKAKFRVATIIEKRVADFATKFNCDKATALKYLKATNYCPNYAARNYLGSN